MEEERKRRRKPYTLTCVDIRSSIAFPTAESAVRNLQEKRNQRAIWKIFATEGADSYRCSKQRRNGSIWSLHLLFQGAQLHKKISSQNKSAGFKAEDEWTPSALKSLAKGKGRMIWECCQTNEWIDDLNMNGWGIRQANVTGRRTCGIMKENYLLFGIRLWAPRTAMRFIMTNGTQYIPFLIDRQKH
jgi:hypothetical protein